MKFTFNWLRDHLDTNTPLHEIVDRLSIIGLEVESVEEPAKALNPFVVARVVDAKQHPNADKLRVCQVDTGSGVVEVVCGAPNARAGMIGVFAPLGSYIPGTGITLDKRPVRGVVSNGMLVSERELELSEDRVLGEATRFALSDANSHDRLVVLRGGKLPGLLARHRRVPLDDRIAVAIHRFDAQGERSHVDQDRRHRHGAHRGLRDAVRSS